MPKNNQRSRIQVDLSPKLLERLDEIAEQLGRTRAGVLRDAMVFFDYAAQARERGGHVSIFLPDPTDPKGKKMHEKELLLPRF